MYPARSNYLFLSESRSKSCSLKPVEIHSYVKGSLICIGDRCTRNDDKIAFEVQKTIESVARFFQKEFGLCGLNGKGTMPPLYIAWNEKNAAWRCGAVDGCTDCVQRCYWIFNDQFALIPEVVAHEYVHGVVHHQSRLNQGIPNCPRNEAGALNESLADVFACAYMHSLGKNDWKIGGVGRDLQVHPRRDHFREAGICNKDSDLGHVHHNSAIPSHAFYIAVSMLGEDRLRDVSHIWFQAMKQITNPNETFESFARKTIRIAQASGSSNILRALKLAWDDVGVIKIPKSKQAIEESFSARFALSRRDAFGEDSYLEEMSR